MAAQREDLRTPEQRKTHTILILALDTFLSGWGEARGGESWAAWACKPEHRQQVHAWVQGRTDTANVRILLHDVGTLPRRCRHLTIHVVGDWHPALQVVA